MICIKFISHRGNNSHGFKENTKCAILSSLSNSYISGVEFDIRLTKDKKIIVYHDSMIMLNNSLYFIDKLNLFDLKDELINTLDEVLVSIKVSKILLIEIKYEGKDYKDVADVVYKCLNKYAFLNVYLCSFNHKLIKYFKKKYDFKCGVIVSKLFNSYRMFGFLDFNVIRYDLYKVVSNKETFVWNVNSKRLLSKMDNDTYIITDKAYSFK
ncbi:MAG: glycerophosphodiester phosphodiesterase family protein [Bacilli bacterium]